MATTAIARSTRSLQRRKIIDRPRLLALLDESAVRVRSLVAPAGYGKTTLAEQWVEKEGRTGVWYTARPSSVDVAALALGIAHAASNLVEGSDVRLREHLRAVGSAGDRVDVLAELVGEELAPWPSSGWLVLDEYQELMRAPVAEHFVEMLVAASPIQILIASRQRPSWVKARGILYGEVLELNQTTLAMDSREAAEVLAGWSAPSASGLVALANGWPAVIGLASVSSGKFDDEAEIHGSLYRFFAEEVFDALGEDVRSGLGTLSLAPVIDRELARDLLGAETEPICSAALDVGILVERGQALELHPLARAFLEERHRDIAPNRQALEVCLSHYREARDWDAAFELIARHEWAEQLEALLRAGLDELLDAARLSTIEAWCALATRTKLEAQIFPIARAELSLRRGRQAEAQAFAEAAATTEGSDLTFRALSVAGRAAHLASREEEALDLYRRAEAAALTGAELRSARWGQLICEIELERPEASIRLRELTAPLGPASPRDLVQAATFHLCHQFTMGSLDLADADRAYEVLGTLDDPILISAFQSAYSGALVHATRYPEALDVATALLEMARRHRLDFAVPYGLCSSAMAYMGMREWRLGHACLNEALAAARVTRATHAQLLCFAVRLRGLAQQGKQREAVELELPSLRDSMPAIRGELNGSCALVLAAAGRLEEAVTLSDRIRGSTRAVEAAILVSAVDAVAALKRREPSAIERISQLAETAYSRGALDLLVTAYRSNPELLAVLLRLPGQLDRVKALIRRVGDEDLAKRVGHSLSPTEPADLLSKREREVFSLLRQGLSNREIAQLLFITPGTVKVHAHHIYDKLGTRSRNALAIQAALERGSQATSTESVGVDDADAS